MSSSQGFGHFEYVNGTVYEGQWVERDGKKIREGEGRLVHAGTTVYEKGNEEYSGHWEDDKMHGYGVYKYTSGAVYSGEWKHNLQDGQGIYEFPDGSIYDGHWTQHQLDGEGVYIDREGTKWEGQFVKGVFQSKMQKTLKNEKAIQFKEQAVLASLQPLFPKFMAQYQASDKKNMKENLQQFFLQGDEASTFLKDITTKYETYPPEKWAEIMGLLKEPSREVVLRGAAMSTVLASENILAQQLNGAGQVVEVGITNAARDTVVAFVNIYEDNWVVAGCMDTKK